MEPYVQTSLSKTHSFETGMSVGACLLICAIGWVDGCNVSKFINLFVVWVSLLWSYSDPYMYVCTQGFEEFNQRSRVTCVFTCATCVSNINMWLHAGCLQTRTTCCRGATILTVMWLSMEPIRARRRVTWQQREYSLRCFKMAAMWSCFCGSARWIIRSSYVSDPHLTIRRR